MEHEWNKHGKDHAVVMRHINPFNPREDLALAYQNLYFKKTLEFYHKFPQLRKLKKGNWTRT